MLENHIVGTEVTELRLPAEQTDRPPSLQSYYE